MSCGVASMNNDSFRWDLGPVPADEIAFAMSLFVAAAQRKILPTTRPTTEAQLLIGQEAQRVFVTLVPSKPVPFPKAAEFQGSSLSEAFLTVWQHYAGDDRQASICARVLGFHLLMERTEGAAVGRWLTPSPSDPEAVLLHPAVIEAVASVPLLDEGRLPEELFIQTVDLHASSRSLVRRALGFPSESAV